MVTSVSIGYAPPQSPSNPPVLPRPPFLPLLRPQSSYVRSLVGFPSCLPAGPAALRWLNTVALSFFGKHVFRILKLVSLFWLPLMADAKNLVQNQLTGPAVSAAGEFTCTLDSPFLVLVIMYHSPRLLSTVFVRFIQQRKPLVFYVLHNSRHNPAKSPCLRRSKKVSLQRRGAFRYEELRLSLPPGHRAGSIKTDTGAPGTSSPPAPARPAPG